MKKIAIDAMGGDFGHEEVVPACLEALALYPHIEILLVGIESVIRPMCEGIEPELAERLQLIGCTETVEMDESPSRALRSKKDSSMRVAIDQVKKGEADACVSAGNTGALMATAKFVLKTVPGISRPAILSRFPTLHDRPVRVVDLGANVDSSADQLFQFALMGSIVAEAVSGIESPTVGLLNIGEEENKGNETVRQAASILADSPFINYHGYVEGNDFFSGAVDVITCDGFVGNVALKAIEGAVRFVGANLQQGFKKNLLTLISGLPALPVMKKVKESMDPRQYNGASLVGLNGVVIKSHGAADRVAFLTAIEEAIAEIDKNIPHLIKTKMAIVVDKMEQGHV